MNKVIYLLLGLLFPIFAFAQAQEIRALIQVGQRGGGQLIYLVSEDGKQIPSIAGSKEIQKALNRLAIGEEAFVTGQVVHGLLSKVESQNIQSYFVINEIRPISLGKLAAPIEKIEDPILYKQFPLASGHQLSFPVSTEVASAITLTSSLILMDNLANAGADPAGRKDMKQALLFSAGTMATLIFLYDQIKTGIK